MEEQEAEHGVKRWGKTASNEPHPGGNTRFELLDGVRSNRQSVGRSRFHPARRYRHQHPEQVRK